jgi:hypothetical protein
MAIYPVIILVAAAMMLASSEMLNRIQAPLIRGEEV